MFNAQRLLGRMVKKGIRRELGTVGAGAIGLGLFGVAIAAFEHLTKDKQGTAPPSAPPPPPATRNSSPPPPPPAASPASASTASEPSSVAEDSQEKAIILIRAMIAAAAADGEIDAAERQAILTRLAQNGADEQERAFLEQELVQPPDLEELLPLVDNQKMAEQFYAASLLAITVDTKEEHDYLHRLAQRLGITDEVVARLHHEIDPE